MTLNQLADSIANQLNQLDNHELKERIKDLFKQEISLYIRRSVRDHGIDNILKLSYDSKLIKVDSFNNIVKEDVKNYVIRTEYRVPTPVRFSNDAPFTKVSSMDGLITIPNRNKREHLIMHSFSFTGGPYSYEYKNGYIVIYDTPDKKFKANYITIESIFESPDEVLSMYNNIDGQDIQLPMPMDMIANAKDRVLQFIGSKLQEDISVKHDSVSNQK